MSIYDAFESLFGNFDRPIKLDRPTHAGSVFYVDAIRGTDEEMGAFLVAPGVTESVRLAVNVSAITARQPEPHEKTDVFLFGTGTTKGIMDPGTDELAPSMTKDLDVSACVYNDKGRLTKEFTFNTSEWSVGHLWVNNESTVELTLIRNDQLQAYRDGLKVGSNRPFGYIDGRDTAFEILEAPIGFGTIETLIRAWETAVGKSAGVILALAGVFNYPYQIISEELIDNAVQFDLVDTGKASKRLNTLDRTAQVNNVVWVTSDRDQMLFHMFEPGQIPASIFEGFDPKRMANMSEKFFDGAIFVSRACLARLRGLMIDRYTERELDIERGLVKFDKPMTYQVRISGGGLIDQHGNRIGMEGHIKAHILVAGGIINERMEEMDIDFLGTTDSFKRDLAVTVEDVIAVVVQPKAPKAELHTSAQHYSAAGLVHQDREDYLQPRARQFKDRLDEILELGQDEELAQAAIAAMADDIEESGDDLLGEVRKGANEVLSTYATLGMRVTDSPAATYALQTNMIQKLGYATLDNAKNQDMTSAGFGRNIDMPAAGFYCQVFPEAFIYASGNWCPQVKPGECYIYSYRGQASIAIISNSDWEKFLSLTGDGDLDDFWNLYFTCRDGKRQALVMRHPAVRGEYMVFDMVASKGLLELWTPMEEKGYIPSLDISKLATRLDKSGVTTMSIKDVYVQVFGGDPNTFSRQQSLEVARTYVQQLTIAATVVLGQMAARGETSQLETSYFMGRPLPNLQNITVDEFVRSRTLVGPIRGSMRSVLKDVESLTPSTQALHSQLREGVSLMPSSGYNDFLSYSLSVMYGVMRKNQEEGVVGGVTYIRDSMERWLRHYLQDIVNSTYDDHGIHTVKTGNTYAYDTQGASQARLYVLNVKRLDDLFGEDQDWKQFTNNGRYFGGITRRTILPSNLDTSELGVLVNNSSISRFVPAASWVRYVYTKRLEHYNQLWDRENNDPDIARPIDLISRRSWLDALKAIDADITEEEDALEFILALFYVLRATPNISIHSLTDSIQQVFGQPGNVVTERLLYTSPFMRWNEEGVNLVLTAFEHAQTYRAEIMQYSEAQPFVPVLVMENQATQYTVFVPEDEQGGSIGILRG